MIHNALDVEDFSPAAVQPALRAEIGVDSGTVIFGSQGRILPRKGYSELIHAAKIALDVLTPAERAATRFVVLGDTPADVPGDYLAACRAQVAALGIEREVQFLGFRRDVKPYVADFDVGVLPSVFSDPLPRAVLETMAMGKPVIAFDVGGVGEMIEDGSTGALVPGTPPDVDALARAIVRYRRDPELRAAQGKRARARVEAGFDAASQTRIIQDEIVVAAGLAG